MSLANFFLSPQFPAALGGGAGCGVGQGFGTDFQLQQPEGTWTSASCGTNSVFPYLDGPISGFTMEYARTPVQTISRMEALELV